MNAIAAIAIPAGHGQTHFGDFVAALTRLVEREADMAAVQEQGASLLAQLVKRDDWLPDAFAQPLPQHYAQYLLYCDPQERFSVVSFVWGPGQSTPIHDHRVWGLVGVLRGAELVRNYARNDEGDLKPVGPAHLLAQGQVDAFGPAIGDVHRVANAIDNGVSISIHVYGANIGKVERATYDDAGRAKPFVSGYVNADGPVLWPAADPA